jgi:large subunit ribosomal protein L21
MYAIIKVGGFQMRAEEGQTLKVPLQTAGPGEKLEISDVLLVNTGKSSLVGTPLVEGAKIEAEVVEHGKNDRIRVYKYKRRTKYRRTQGHRQGFTEIKVNKIVTP